MSSNYSAKYNFVALDCGNSSIRIVLGRYDGKQVNREIIDQFPNDMINAGGLYYWDILNIFRQFISSLKKAVRKAERIDSIGICTWGVDFSLFDRKSYMIGNPLAYRNELGVAQYAALDGRAREKMFFETGILCDKINSVYMLKGLKDEHPDIFSAADKLLMIPDILNYLATGEMINEPSELSTTQMLDVRTAKISKNMCDFAGVSPSVFSAIGVHGKKIGMLSDSIRMEIGVDYDIPVICVPSHDTASAVLSIPAEHEEFAFISSGTWSLIGMEIDAPVLNTDMIDASLTNELGAFGRITMLKNCMGMFIIHQVKKEYELAIGHAVTWDDLVDITLNHKGELWLFDINANRFFNPKNMSAEIWKYYRETGLANGEIIWETLIPSIYYSMACCYAITFSGIERTVEKTISDIYIVGGGVNNSVLNQLTANMTGKKVVACDSEGTSLGNILCQIKYFEPDRDISSLRGVAGRSIEKKIYEPADADVSLVRKYEALLEKH